MDTDSICIEPTVERCGSDRRIAAWRWIAAPAHVRRFIEGRFVDVIAELARLGYAFSVEPVERHVSIVAWYAARPHS